MMEPELQKTVSSEMAWLKFQVARNLIVWASDMGLELNHDDIKRIIPGDYEPEQFFRTVSKVAGLPYTHDRV